MANTDGNDPRLRQDKIERKDKENSNAGMIGGIIIVILGVVCLLLLFYFFAPQNIQPATPTVVATPNTAAPQNQPATTTQPTTTTATPPAQAVQAPATTSP